MLIVLFLPFLLFALLLVVVDWCCAWFVCLVFWWLPLKRRNALCVLFVLCLFACGCCWLRVVIVLCICCVRFCVLSLLLCHGLCCFKHVGLPCLRCAFVCVLLLLLFWL